jgi:hypothetical protein
MEKAYEEIRSSLLDQLKELNKDTPYARKVVDNIVKSFRDVDRYEDDIEKNGVSYPDARGIIRPNPSIDNKRKEQASINASLKLFDLQNPVIRSDMMDDYV